jgi:hypothetical protein
MLPLSYFISPSCTRKKQKKIKCQNYGSLLPIVLYVCGTWSLVLREWCRLGVFKNDVVTRIFAPKKDEVRKVEKIV